MHCSICETRRPRRYCPGLRSEICSICCGASREVTVACPLECPYLGEARKHEKPPEPDMQQYPSPEVELSEDFLRGNEQPLPRSRTNHGRITRDSTQSRIRCFPALRV